MRSVSESVYLQTHRQTLTRLFEELGEDLPAGDAELVRWMEQHWLGTEHGAGVGKPTYDAELVDKAWPLLQRLDLVDRKDPQRRSYDEVVVMGATSIGLYRRLKLVRSAGVHAPVLTVLAGQRPHSGLDSDGGLREYLDPVGRFAAAAGWTPAASLVTFAALLDKTGVDPLVAARIVVPTETDMARHHLGRHWPTARLASVMVERADQDVLVEELGPRTFVWERYDGAAELPTIRLLNAAPVRRLSSDGTERAPRPTSRSSIRELVAVWDEPPASILWVVNQPHLSRVAGDIEAELAAAGIASSHSEVVGCEVLRASVDINLVLGEIPARINMELGADSWGGRNTVG